MRPADPDDAVSRAKAPALAVFEENERRAPRRLRPVFAAMRELAFVPDLGLEQILRHASLDDPEVWSDLREEAGDTPWNLLRNARLETAAHLLLETPASVREIGEEVGYTSPTSFRGALKNFLGMPPAEYRRRARRLLERAQPAPAGADTVEYWERALAGGLTDAEARSLDDYLERLAPGSAPDARPDDEDERFARARRMLADGLVDTLNRLTFPYQRRLARDAVAFPDLTFFERLSRESREAAGDDPERSVEWALLAVDSLAANHMLETHPQTASLARARLALARWRAGDVRGAIGDVRQSMRDDERARQGDRFAAPEAERSRMTAAFYWFGGRRRNALTLADGAVAAYRVDGLPGLRRALMLRAEVRAALADMSDGAGDEASDGAGDGASRREAPRAALADVEEARALSADGADGDALADLTLWLRILVLLGDPAEKAVALPRARSLAPELGDAASPLLLWFEGHCSAAAAEPSWRRAREGFAAGGDELWSARATLDLARLCLRQDRAADAAEEAAKLVATLGTLAQGAEDSAALKVLARSAAPAPAVTDDGLEAVEQILKRLEWDRRAHRRALALAT